MLDSEIGQKVLKLCVFSFGGLAFASLSFGFISRLKVQQIAGATPLELKDLKNSCTNPSPSISRSHNGIYCKLQGVVDTDGVPLVAPESRKQVVLFDTYYKKTKEHKTAQMNFCLSSVSEGQKTKVEVDTEMKIDVLKLERAVNRFTVREEVLELGKPVFVVGEVRYVPHGERLIISRPLFGLPFVIAATDEDTLLKALSFRSNIYFTAGSLFALTSLWCYARIILDRLNGVVLPTF